MQHNSDDLDRLVRFYTHYAPERVHTASLTLASYEGRVDLLFRALEKKYGPELAAEKPAQTSIPQRIESPTQGAVTKQQPIVPPVLPAAKTALHLNHHRSRLERFFQHYAPEKSDSVDATLAANRGREEALFRELEKKYGPEPRAFVVVTPRGALPHSSNDALMEAGDGDEGNAFYVDPSVAGPAAGPDPKNVPQHVPYDYCAVLRQLGLREDFVDKELTAFGPDKQPYAAAITVLAVLLGNEALFDADPDRTLTFPFHSLKELKRTAPDALDGFAFEHLLVYRTWFISALQHVLFVKHIESLERQQLYQRHLDAVGNLSHRMVVLREAVQQIQPMEDDRRRGIYHEERIRYNGLVLWFRQRRIEIVSGVPLLHSAESTTDHVCHAVSSPPRLVRLVDTERQLKRVNDAIREQSDALVAKWVHQPPQSSIRSSSIGNSRTPIRATFSSKSTGRTQQARGASSSTSAYHPAHDTTPCSHSAHTPQQDRGHARDRSHSPNMARSPSQQQSLPKWMPTGPARMSHNVVASTQSMRQMHLKGTAGDPSEPVDASPAPQHQSAPVVVREHLHYDPFGRDVLPNETPTAGFMTHDGLLLCAASPQPLSSRTPSVQRSAAQSSTNRSHSASQLIPYEIERTVRLKKVASKGSFSAMRHCAATDAKRFFASSAAVGH